LCLWNEPYEGSCPEASKTKRERLMEKISLKTIWMAVMVGLLIATAPSWMFDPKHQTSNYDAPWIYPGCFQH
jgi:hypothetical protein